MAHRRMIGNELVLQCKRDPERPGHFLVKLRPLSQPHRWWHFFRTREKPAARWESMSQQEYSGKVCFEAADHPSDQQD